MDYNVFVCLVSVVKIADQSIPMPWVTESICKAPPSSDSKGVLLPCMHIHSKGSSD